MGRACRAVVPSIFAPGIGFGEGSFSTEGVRGGDRRQSSGGTVVLPGSLQALDWYQSMALGLGMPAIEEQVWG